MGKRGRQRGSTSGGGKPRASGSSRVEAPPEPVEKAGVLERAKASWAVASDVAPDRNARDKIADNSLRPTKVMGRAAGVRTVSKREEREAARAEARRRSGGKRQTRLERRGERPPSPFGRWPVTELATLVGLVLIAIGLALGAQDHARAVEIGVVLVALAALESAVREHLFGYRSHALFLGLLVVIVVHMLVIAVAGGAAGRSDITFGVDVVLFAGIAYFMHQLYQRRLVASPGVPRRSTPKAAGGR